MTDVKKLANLIINDLAGIMKQKGIISPRDVILPLGFAVLWIAYKRGIVQFHQMREIIKKL